ncbi:hypothetical protein GGF44_002091 [Coemansia sp. RSA 1694]|nr:hypothetical protein GGF38_004867 [Coemansia sp. RSA 25]KAJ2507823.1 hypothetical protein IWW47_000917 [Coemansia sp. RSA 2052]KAJ2641499.1 hypothetical protein GGF44_002091 [Coemansia sp. RSA 1694]
MRLLRGVAAILAISVCALLVRAWPTTGPFPASVKPPSTWGEVKALSDPGVLHAAASMALAAASGDTLVSFSIQASSVSAIPGIYVIAYSLETGSIIAPVGFVKTSEFGSLGIAKGGMVSIRIPEPAINNLASASRLSAVRLAIFAPTLARSAGQWASDSVILVLGSSSAAKQDATQQQASTQPLPPHSD